MRAASVMVAVSWLMVLLGAPAASAQGRTYGVKAGVTLADLHEDDDGTVTPFDFRTGVVVGGFVTWPLGSRLAFQPEVLFAQKGAKAELGGGTLTQKLDYVDVPILVSYRLVGGTERHFAVFGGPAIGLRVRARSSAAVAGGGTFEEDVSDAVKRTDLSVVGGLAYHRGRLVVDGRYAWGVSDIDRDTSDEVKITNRGLSFLAGWTF